MEIIQIVSDMISLFFGLFALVFIAILPLMGIYFDYNMGGMRGTVCCNNCLFVEKGIQCNVKWSTMNVD